jgi:hypothetical protein
VRCGDVRCGDGIRIPDHSAAVASIMTPQLDVKRLFGPHDLALASMSDGDFSLFENLAFASYVE